MPEGIGASASMDGNTSGGLTAGAASGAASAFTRVARFRFTGASTIFAASGCTSAAAAIGAGVGGAAIVGAGASTVGAAAGASTTSSTTTGAGASAARRACSARRSSSIGPGTPSSSALTALESSSSDSRATAVGSGCGTFAPAFFASFSMMRVCVSFNRRRRACSRAAPYASCAAARAVVASRSSSSTFPMAAVALRFAAAVFAAAPFWSISARFPLRILILRSAASMAFWAFLTSTALSMAASSMRNLPTAGRAGPRSRMSAASSSDFRSTNSLSWSNPMRPSLQRPMLSWKLRSSVGPVSVPASSSMRGRMVRSRTRSSAGSSISTGA